MRNISDLARRNRLLIEIVAGVVVLGAGIGIGFGLSGLGASATQVTASSGTLPTTPPASSNGARTGLAKSGLNGVRGQITAESGQTWTVVNRAGRSFTVNLTSTTKFGTLAQPAQSSQFVTGSQVAVIGRRSGTTVTATRVLVPKTVGAGAGAAVPSGGSTTTTTPSAGTGTGTVTG